MMVIDVTWETDGEDVDLPEKVELPEGMDPEDNEKVCEWLSSEYGWLVQGYCW